MKAKLSLAFLSLLLTLSVVSSHAASSNPIFRGKSRTTNMTEEQKVARLEEITSRVNEIKASDMTTMSKSEKKALKKELKSMNKEARVMRGGVYLSVGAIIIIILLLILIL